MLLLSQKSCIVLLNNPIVLYILFRLICLIYIFFRISVNSIKRRREDVEVRVYTFGYKDGPKIIIYRKYYFHNYLIGLGSQELEES